MKISFEYKLKPRFRELWKKSIRRIILHLRIIKLMQENTDDKDKDFSDYLVQRSLKYLKLKTEINLPFCISLPDSRIKEIWGLYIGFLLIYTATITPFTISFLDVTSGNILFMFDIIIDICFLVDVLWNLNTSYYNEENILISRRWLILKNYLKKGLIVDAISSFPFTLFDITSHSYSSLLRIFRLRALSRLLKLSKLFKVVTKKDLGIIKEIQAFLCISHSFQRLIKFLFTMLLSIHIAACIWHWTSSFYDNCPGTWVFETGNVDSPIYRRYLLSLYWAMVTLGTIGYGDLRPYSNTEKIFAILWMIFALYFLSFAISSLSSMLSQIDIKKTVLRQKMAFIDDFSKEVKLSKRLKKELQKKLLDSIDRFNYSYSDRITLVNQFPKDLKLEIAYTMQKGYAARFDIFASEDDNLMLEILPLMQILTLQGMQSIYSYGENSTKIYFIISGRVHLLLNNEKTVFQVFGDNGYFGDIELLMNIPRLNTAVTATECRFMIMSTDIVKKIQAHFSSFYYKMKEAAHRRYIISQRARAEMKMLVEISKTECINKNNIGHIKDVIRKETVYNVKNVGFSKKYFGKIAAVENLEKTSVIIEECKESIAKINGLLDLL